MNEIDLFVVKGSNYRYRCSTLRLISQQVESVTAVVFGPLHSANQVGRHLQSQHQVNGLIVSDNNIR